MPMTNVASKSYVGTYRPNNEDTVWAGGNMHGNVMVIACDGLGGHAGGEIASRLALETFTAAFSNTDFNAFGVAEMKRWFKQTTDTTREKISAKVKAHKHLESMATTVTGAVISNKSVFVFNCGDSRTYLVKGKAVRQISVDHNVFNSLKAQGASREVWDRYAGRLNALTSCVGSLEAGDIELDVFVSPRREADFVVACTDGFSSFVDEAALAKVAKADTLDAFVEEMIQEAVSRDSNDNITLAVAAVDA